MALIPRSLQLVKSPSSVGVFKDNGGDDDEDGGNRLNHKNLLTFDYCLST